MDPDIPKDLQQEVDALVDRVAAFRRQGPQTYLQGAALLEQVQAYGLPLPPEFLALYHNHNGADPGATMTWHQMTVFLDWLWPGLESVISVNRVARVREEFPSPDRIWMAREMNRFTALELFPQGEVDGQVPLLATMGPLSAVTCVAFDSPLLMLRSVVAAQEAGLSPPSNAARHALLRRPTNRET